jgi:arylsulfatase A-like enzyme
MSQPNILFILADDLGWGDVGFHGAPIATPNIDRLAAEGVELRQHYVCPMCTPTRAALLTGRYPGRFGAHATVPSNAPVLPDGYPTLATVLGRAGYQTGLFGKWHLGSSRRFAPNHYGFDTSYGSLAGGVDPYNHRYKQGEFSVTWHRDGELVQEQGHVTDLIATAAVEWIESRDGPFFCYVPFTAVHVPVKPLQSWLERYGDQRFDADPLKDASFRKYAAYTSHMDAAVGKLLETLERTGQRDNTLIVFTSDNGAINDCPLHGSDQYPGWQEAYPRLGSNGPLRGVKAQLYEGGVRTPAIANWRGTLEPGRLETPVQVADWMPTLTGLAGAAPQRDPHWDGMDIWPVVAGRRDDAAERAFYWNFRGGARLGLRYGDWKLIESHDDGATSVELFNIATDPYEQNEVAADMPQVVAHLSEGIRQQRLLDDTAKRDEVDSPQVG